jgi:hypothetical protein
MRLETQECICLYAFLKLKEDELSLELERILRRCENCVSAGMTIEEMELLTAPKKTTGDQR